MIIFSRRYQTMYRMMLVMLGVSIFLLIQPVHPNPQPTAGTNLHNNNNVLIVHAFPIALESQLTPFPELLRKVSEYYEAARVSVEEVQFPLTVHDISQLSLSSYAAFHKYDYRQVFIDPMNITNRGVTEEWGKIFTLRRLLERERRYEWLVLVDGETIVLDVETSLVHKMERWNWMADIYLEEDCHKVLDGYLPVKDSVVEAKKETRTRKHKAVLDNFIITKISQTMQDFMEEWIIQAMQEVDIAYANTPLSTSIALNKYMLPKSPQVLMHAISCGDLFGKVRQYTGTTALIQAFHSIVFHDDLVKWRSQTLQAVATDTYVSKEILNLYYEYIRNFKFVETFELPARNGSIVKIPSQLKLLAFNVEVEESCKEYDISEELCEALEKAMKQRKEAYMLTYAERRMSYFVGNYQKTKKHHASIPLQEFMISPERNVIYTIFAGRFDRLSIMMKYIHLALGLHIIREVHIWDFCRHKKDQISLQSLVDIEKGIFLKSRSSNRNVWHDYYEYYYDYSIQYPNAIIIKSDDDIVFMDVLQWPSLFKMFESNLTGIIYPNIVNNGVAAHFQQNELNFWPKDDIGIEFDYPLHGLEGGLWKSGEKALKLHHYFLDHWKEMLPTEVPVVNHVQRKSKVLTGKVSRYLPHLFIIDTRFSINMFAIRARDWYMIRNVGEDDEFIISVIFPELNYFPTYMHTNLIVSHFSFGSQQLSKDFQAGEAALLQRYQQLFGDYVATLEIR